MVKVAQAFVVVCLAFGVLAGTAAAGRWDEWTGPVTGTFGKNFSDLSCAPVPGYDFQWSVHYRGTVDTGGSTADLAVDACVTDPGHGGEQFVGSFSLRDGKGTLRGYAAGHEEYYGVTYFQIALRNAAHGPIRLIFQGCNTRSVFETGEALLDATIGRADAPTDRSCTGLVGL
jgi:hypothetical protein